MNPDLFKHCLLQQASKRRREAKEMLATLESDVALEKCIAAEVLEGIAAAMHAAEQEENTRAGQ